MKVTNRRKSSAAKSQRLEARITVDQKRRLEYAARLRGASLTDFVVLSATEAANRTVSEQELMRLSERDTRAFVEALLSPPAPSPRLAAAAKRYREGLRGR